METTCDDCTLTGMKAKIQPLNRLTEMVAETKAMGGIYLFLLCATAASEMNHADLVKTINTCASETLRRGTSD